MRTMRFRENMKILRASNGSYNSRALIACMKIFSCVYMILILSGVHICINILRFVRYIRVSRAVISSCIISLTKREGGGDLPDDPRRNLFRWVCWKFITRLSTTLTALGHNDQVMGLPWTRRRARCFRDDGFQPCLGGSRRRSKWLNRSIIAVEEEGPRACAVGFIMSLLSQPAWFGRMYIGYVDVQTDRGVDTKIEKEREKRDTCRKSH